MAQFRLQNARISKKENEHKDITKRTFNIWSELKWNWVDQCLQRSASTAIISDVSPSRVQWCWLITMDLYGNGYDGDPGTSWLYKQRECVWHFVYVWKDSVACCDNVVRPSLDINSPNEGKWVALVIECTCLALCWYQNHVVLEYSSMKDWIAW